MNIRKAVRELYSKYIQAREQSLLEAVTAGAALGGLISDQLDFSEINPQMQEAWELAYPNVDIVSLTEYSTSSLEGFVNGWKGKYFEVLVRDKLNAGEVVGDIQLGAGQVAELAPDPTQEGWDLLIREADGTIAQDLQLKATESIAYAKSALLKNPNIEVLTTEEALEGSDTIPDGIFSSGMSEEDLEAAIRSPMEDLLDSTLENVTETILPVLPFVLITVGEGRQVFMGRKSFESAMATGLQRAAKTGISIGAGYFVEFIFGVWWISIPVTISTRLGLDRLERMTLLNGRLAQKQWEIKKLLSAT